MTTTGEQIRRWQGPAVLSYGFRPFFLGAAVWAAVAMALWSAMLSGRPILPIALDPVTWHAHEFLFGYLGAVIAGFLLTAVPNWTGRLPVVGWPLLGLVLLWVLGRIVMATGGFWPSPWVAVADLAFLVAMAGFLAREIVAGRNWKNLAVLALLLVLIAGNALFHAGILRGGGPGDGAWQRLTVAGAILLIALIGGRIVPSFTRNWLVQRGDPRRPAPPMQALDRGALLALLAALSVWIAAPGTLVSGLGLMAAGALHGLRLFRWRGLATLAEPLLWVLHLGYAFVPIGALGLGLAQILDNTALTATSLHLWTVGALGTMTLGVMTRATLGHTGAPLRAGPLTALIYLALPVAALLRVAAPFSAAPQAALAASALLWVAAFAGFALTYGPRLIRPRR